VPRLTADQWQEIRAKREAGASFGELAAQFDVTKAAIIKHSKAENWGDGSDAAEIIRRKVTEQVTGAVTGGDPKKREAALDAEAARAAEVIHRHRQEWEIVAALRDEALEVREVDHAEAFGRAKLAKITAEMTAIQQAGERKAWGLDAADRAPDTPIAGFRMVPIK
jgi:hypothetical protein